MNSRWSMLVWLWPLLFLFLLGPILLFPERFPLWAVVGALAIVLALFIVRAGRSGRLLPATPINFLLVPLIIIFLPLSLWVSPLFWEASWPKATSLLWSVAIFYAVVGAVPAELAGLARQHRSSILTAIYLMAGVLMTAVGLLALDSSESLLPFPAAMSELGNYLGQSVNPNEVGGIITLYLPLVVAFWAGVWAFPERRSYWRFALWSLLAFFFTGALLLSTSFGAVLGIIAGCGLVLLLLNRRTRLFLVPLGTMALVATIAVRASPLSDQLVLAFKQKWFSSIITRLDIWSQAWQSSQDFPIIGTGLGTFRYAAPVLYPLAGEMQDVGHAHNLFWQAALDFGLLGGILFAAIWIVLFATLARSLRETGQTNSEVTQRLFIVGLLGSLLAHALYSLVDALAPGARPAFALWFLFGLAVVAGATAEAGYERTQGRRLVATTTLLAVSFVVLAWLFLPLQRASSTTANTLLNDRRDIEDTAVVVGQAAQDYCRANWHLGMLEHARGSEEYRNQAWQQLLSCTAQLTPMMRQVAPGDHALAQAAVAAQPADAESYFWLAAVEAENANYDEAASYYERGLVLAPGDGVRLVELGQAREKAGDIEGALIAYDEACRLVDRGFNGCPRAGRLYLNAGFYDLAADRYRTSLEQAPGYSPAQWGLANSLLALRRTAEAVPYLESLAENGDSKAQEKLRELTRGEQ